MPTSAAKTQIIELLAAKTKTDPADWYLCFKARYGLERILSALASTYGAGKSVITMPYTCVTAVTPIVAAGLVPRYVDIDEQTLNADADQALEKDSEAVAYMLQHTFGVRSEDTDQALARAVHERGALLIEDSAHCLSYLAKDADGSILADVSVHSFGVEKMLAKTYFGGAIYVNPTMQDKVLEAAIRASLSELPELDVKLSRAAKHYRTALRAIMHAGPLARVVKKSLLALSLFEPAVAELEQKGELPYAAQSMDEAIALSIRPHLRVLADNELHRMHAQKCYLDAFADTDALNIPSAAKTSAPLLRFPIFLKDKDTADACHKALADAGIYSVRWYEVPLLPGVLDEERLHFSRASYAEDFPQSYHAGERALGLPTDVTDDVIATIVSIIQTNARG